MNLLRALLLTAVTLLAFARQGRCAWRDDFPLGYDADHRYYFHRVSSFDNSMQFAVDAGCAYYGTSLLQAEDYRNVNDFDPAARQLMLGVMGEKNFFKAYCSVSVGLSYMMLRTYMLQERAGLRTLPFGAFLPSGSGYVVTTNTSDMVDYSFVKNVSTSTSYISIPIEVKYEFICKEEFGIYLKGALRTSINLATNTYFDALPTASTETKKLIENFFKNDNALFVNANAYLGFRFGSYDKSNFRAELGMPFSLTKNVANVSTKRGFGFRVSYFIPLSIFTPYRHD